MIARKDVLSKVNTYDIMVHFLKDYYEEAGEPIEEGIHIYVPEISGKQRTPSFNIYYSKNSNEWRYKTFTGHDGSAFDLVMNMYGVSFPKAIKIINQEMNLGLDDTKVDYKKLKPKEEYTVKTERNYNYELVTGKWTKRQLKYWAQFGVGLETLLEYNYRPVQRLSYFNRHNVSRTIESAPESLIFCFERDGWGKLYMPKIPEVQNKMFLYFGKKPKDYVFGLEQLPKTGDSLYLVGGEKDVISLRGHDINAVCMNSEESTPRNYPELIELIRSGRFKKQFVMMDNDDSGRRRTLDISLEFPELRPKFLDIPDDWDISDYIKNKYDKLMF